jgi:hypothetical protein
MAATATCAICYGRIALSTVGSGVNHPVWVHLDQQDWINDPHNAEPREKDTDGTEHHK